MRVIWVTPALPHPDAAGGWAHEFELIAAMAHHHDIEVLSSDLDGPLDPSALADIDVPFTRVRWTPRPYPQRKAAIAWELLRADPDLVLWTRRDRLVQLSAALEAMISRRRPDLVHITLGELAPLIGVAEIARVPTALLLFDSLTREIAVRLAVEPLLRRRLQMRVEQRRTRRFENLWYRRADKLAAVSRVDAAWFEDLLGRELTVLENPVAEMFTPASDPEPTSGRVTFVGTLNHRPNSDAIEWLARDIWPLVRERRPDASLVVVGRGDRSGEQTRRLRGLVESVGGRLDADVDDIVAYYRDAEVVVAPVRLGAGLKNKVLHAMACQVPVVATPVALEGVPAEAAAAAVCATSAEEIAAGVCALLDDRDRAMQRAADAARAVEPLRTRHVAAAFENWWMT